MKTVTVDLLKMMALFPATLCDVNCLFVWPFFCFLCSITMWNKSGCFWPCWILGNFGVVVWGSQQFCTPSWQNFIRGLMQLKYFSFKWSRKTHSHWVVKSGRVLYVHLWRMGLCVCQPMCVCVLATTLFVYNCRFQMLFQKIYLSYCDYFAD